MGIIISMLINFVTGTIRLIIRLFVDYVDICDCLLVGFLVWLSVVYGLNLHSGVAFLIALVVVAPLYFLFAHKIGFWIVSVVFSAIWSWAFIELVVKGLFNAQLDIVWYSIWSVICFILFFGSHSIAQERCHRFIKEVWDTTEETKADNPTFHELDSKDFEYNPIADYQAVVDKERLRRKGKITE